MKGIWCLAKPANFGVSQILPNIKTKNLLEGSSRYFLYCNYMIPPLYEPYMNFRAVFKNFFKRFLDFLFYILSVPFFGQKINAHF